MSLLDAMHNACRAVGIEPPRRVTPGRWAQCRVEGKAKGNTSGRVMVNDDGRSGVAYNWATGQHVWFTVNGADEASAPALRRDPEKERQRETERREVMAICARIVTACEVAPHPYLARKGFATERGLVIDDPRRVFPASRLGEAMGNALPEGEGPMLVIPGRVGREVRTVQFITPEGAKKNILRGQMGGTAHRIATGAETWVCEGIATALSVRAALRFLGRSATVLCAFSAGNVAKVAEGIPCAIIAADHDAPQETLGGLGAGEFYARRTGLRWVMPAGLGDWNDVHQAEGLRAVALALREIMPP